MIKAVMMAMVMMANSTQVATVVETCDNVMIIETQDGNLWEYEYDRMTDAEKYAETVLLIKDEVVVIK